MKRRQQHATTTLLVTICTCLGTGVVATRAEAGAAATKVRPRAPQITTAWRDVISPAQPMTPFTVRTSGGAPTTLTASGLPSGLRFRDDGDGTGTFTGTADESDVGQFHITITASNAEGTTRQGFDLAVLKEESRRTLLLLAGQSNATGVGAYATDPKTGVDYLAPPYANAADASSTLSWLPWRGYPAPEGGDAAGQVPLDTAQFLVETDGVRLQIFGPEIGWARQTYAATGEAVSVVKAAFAGTSLAVDWDPTNRSGIYAQMIAKVTATMSRDAQDGQLDTIGGIAWYQGEADAEHPAMAERYRVNLEAFIAAMRADLPLSPGVRIVLVKESLANSIESDQKSGACAHTQTCAALAAGDRDVRAADDWAAAHIPDVSEVDTLGLPRSPYLGGVHLTNTSELSIGRDIGIAIEQGGTTGKGDD